MKNLLIVILSVFIFGCSENILGKKEPSIDYMFPPIPATDERKIEFIQLAPVWYGFNQPEDIMVGFDDLIYVADTKNNRIVQLDANGSVLGTISINNPVAIAQDRKLDLLVAARFDTIINNNKINLACIYRINLVKVNHKINLATAQPVVIHPNYILGRTLKSSDSTIYFTGISTLADNEYFIARRGNENTNITQSGGTDNAVLWFNSKDKILTPLTTYLSALGSGKTSANKISSISSYAMPPQRATVDARKSFLLTLVGENNFRVQGVKYSSGREDVAFTSDPNLDIIDTTLGHRFLYDENPKDEKIQGGFIEPEDVTYAADRGFIFVVDSKKDSVYQFTSNGIEGIIPPTYSKETKNIIVSFGGSGSGVKQFKNPKGIAYYQNDKILLVADTGNNRILRFKLSTDYK